MLVGFFAAQGKCNSQFYPVFGDAGVYHTCPKPQFVVFAVTAVNTSLVGSNILSNEELFLCHHVKQRFQIHCDGVLNARDPLAFEGCLQDCLLPLVQNICIRSWSESMNLFSVL